MNRRVLTITLLVSFAACAGLVACGEEESQGSEEQMGPLVGLYELPISLDNQGSEPSGAVRIEIATDAISVDGTKLLDLERGRPADAEVRDHAITKLRERIDGGPARSRASIKVAAMVPYLTLVEAMKTLQDAGLREVSFAVRTPGETPSEGWMQMTQWTVAPADAEEVELPGRPLPWSAFTEHWQAVYDACRAGRYVDCDAPYANVAEGGELEMTLWTRGQAMKVTYRQTNAPEPEAGGGGGGGGVALIEGIAPAPAAEGGQQEEPDPATEGSFTLRHQEATSDPSAITNVSRPVCANQSCQATLVTDAATPSMRVISFLGAAFPNGFNEPSIALRIPEE